MERFKRYKKQETRDKKQAPNFKHFKSWFLRFGFCLYLVSWSLVINVVFAERQQIDESTYYDSKSSAFSLSLEDVSQLALHNNFDIQLAQYDAQIARTDQGVAESIYDTIIAAEFNYNKDNRARKSTIAGTESIQTNYNIGATKKLPTGTTVSVDFTNNRDKTDSSFATINPAYDSALGINVKQDFGKNFFGLKDRGDIKITRLDIENADYTSLDKIESEVANVQKAYWELVLEKGRVEVQTQMVQQAKRLYDLYQEKIHDGLVEQAELLASEANYQSRVNELLLAQNLATTKENTLKLLLNLNHDDTGINPKDIFILDTAQQQLDLSLKQAFENRRDYRRAENDIKSRNINLTMKKNDMWPEINLEASFARNGISDRYNKAFDDIGQEDNPDIFAGLTVSFPLEKTKEKSQLKAAEIEKTKALVNMKFVEKKIAINIMDQVRSCNVYKELALNADRIAELQNNKLNEEEKRFKWGRSDTDTIIRFQEDAIGAQLVALEAKFRYYSALVDLSVEESSLLNKYWEDQL